MQRAGYRQHRRHQLCTCPLDAAHTAGLPANPSQVLEKPRYLFIDLYRTAVILLMLEGHVFRTFLQKDLQQSNLFQLHEFFHGLTAAAFLFGAGMTFVISTRRRWLEFHHWGEPVAKRIRRYLLILALGLVVHLPFFSFRKIMIDALPADLLQLFQSDVLACIGFGLILLQGLVFLFKTETRFYVAVSIITVMVCVLTPLTWEVDFLKILPLPAAQLLNGLHGSPFPLFPFVGFLFAGAIVSWELLAAGERGEEHKFSKRLGLIGAGLVLAGILSDVIPIQIYPTYDFWLTSPAYFFIRVGALLLITYGFWRLAGRFSQTSGTWTILGRESLFVYVIHLFLLYGSAVNPQLNLQVFLGQDLGFGASLLVLLALSAFLLGCAALWNYLRKDHLPVYRLIQLGVSGVFLYYFFTRDF
jgi:heparan-alpha-glucosaminide N-acetyltransferase-like protein